MLLSRCRRGLLVIGRKRLSGFNELLEIHPEIQEAIASKKPIVALETTLVTHGFPYPTNVNLSLQLEDIVRSTGAIPATIAVMGGKVKIGMERTDLEQLVDTSNGMSPIKVSRRDIAACIVNKANGGTTCSATLIFAAMTGIKVFATGGLGGVHRGGELSMDVSADLFELSRCPVGLVSSGIKSILDIRRTLEYLETLGVPVLSYGPSREFPAFFSRRSGIEVPWNAEDALTAAKILYTQKELGLQNGALIGVPIPDKYEADGAVIQAAIDQAVRESEENGVSKRGGAATPWLLSRIAEITKGDSRAANIALLENTALIGGQIAMEYQKLDNAQDHRTELESSLVNRALPQNTIQNIADPTKQLTPAKVLVVGCSAVDISATCGQSTNPALSNHSTVPGSVVATLGGVGRNISVAAQKMLGDNSVLLVSPLGDDAFGAMIQKDCETRGMRTDGLQISKSGQRTAVCNMLFDQHGALVSGIADMEITAQFPDTEILDHLVFNNPKLLALDANLSPNTLRSVAEYCSNSGIDVFFETTSLSKSTAILGAAFSLLRKNSSIKFVSPNLLELVRMYSVCQEEPYNLTSNPKWWSVIDKFSLGTQFQNDLGIMARLNVSEFDSTRTLSFLSEQGIAQMAVNLLPLFQHIVVKCGEKGILVVMRLSEQHIGMGEWHSLPSSGQIVVHGESEIIVLRHFPPLQCRMVNATGAGDSCVGAILAALTLNQKAFETVKSLEKTISLAQQAAVLTLESTEAVSPLLSNINMEN
ncbi:indigoidine synthase A-like protein [Mycena floridula]|nr:indigoidine synthase A-like protein [Mycena floridula]